MQTMSIIKDGLIISASIIGAIGVISGAMLLILKVFKTPAKVEDLEKRIFRLESEKAVTKLYTSGIKEDIAELKDKINRIEDLLLGRKGAICK